MLIIEKKSTLRVPAKERLTLPFELRCKSRLRARLENGEEAGLFLEHGSVLRPGDLLEANDGRIVQVVAATEAVMEVRSTDPVLLARAAYHLGNRHIALEIRAGLLRFASDHVLADMLRTMGLDVVSTEAAFDPEGGAYRSHGHSSEGEGRGPRLHDMILRAPA